VTAVDLHPTSCAICDTEGSAEELYPANFHVDAFSPAIFSARRLPDRIHYRMVRCQKCGLVRSDPVANAAAVAELYGESTFDYGGELENLARTYGAYLRRLDRYGAIRGSIFEIGCGNGFFLAQARAQGYRDLHGVEPSQAAIDLASEEIRGGIVHAMMGPGLFPDASFDVVCLFQVLDHLFDPAGILKNCLQILKPGGLLLCLNHNVEALSARLMKDRSPIVDIEHTYLYSPATIQRLLDKAGFVTLEIGKAWNTYSLGYLLRLVPFPSTWKQFCLRILRGTFLDRLPLRVPLGNLYVIARKPFL
jgi:SAM-dependent methyltransferase